MSSIVTAVFKAIIGFLVNKGRDKMAEQLKNGDLTSQRLRELVVREIDDIKSKLDGLARKDLLTGISYLRKGIVHLFELLEKANGNEDNFVRELTTTVLEGKNLEVVLRSSGADTVRNVVSKAAHSKALKLSQLDEAEKRSLSNAKESFKVACLKATEAFHNEALSMSDRIQAMVIRVAATILEKVDYPEDAVAEFRLCVEELHAMPAVRSSFGVELKKGFRALFNKAERNDIIATVYRINRVIYDVSLDVCYDKLNLLNWPCVDYGGDKVNPLKNKQLAETLSQQGLEHLLVSWEEELLLTQARAIATNSEGQLIVIEAKMNLKIFSGEIFPSLQYHLEPDLEGLQRIGLLYDVASDQNDNIYVLAEIRAVIVDEVDDEMPKGWVWKFRKTGDLEDKFCLLRENIFTFFSMTVSSSDKLLMLGSREFRYRSLCETKGSIVDVYDTDGNLVQTFEENIENALDIAAANSGRFMVVKISADGSYVHMFNENGDQLLKFNVELRSCLNPKIAVRRVTEQVVIATDEKLLIYSEHGKLVCDVELGRVDRITGITELNGRLAVVFRDVGDKFKLFVC